MPVALMTGRSFGRSSRPNRSTTRPATATASARPSMGSPCAIRSRSSASSSRTAAVRTSWAWSAATARRGSACNTWWTAGRLRNGLSAMRGVPDEVASVRGQYIVPSTEYTVHSTQYAVRAVRSSEYAVRNANQSVTPTGAPYRVLRTGYWVLGTDN